MVWAKYSKAENVPLFYVCMTPVKSSRLQFSICCCFSIGERINTPSLQKCLFTHCILEKTQGHKHHQSRALSLYWKNTMFSMFALKILNSSYGYFKKTDRYFGLTADTMKINFPSSGDTHTAGCAGCCSSPWKGVVGCWPASTTGRISEMKPVIRQSALL